MNPLTLADAIINGKRLTKADAPAVFIEAPLSQLREGADRLRAHFVGEAVELCSIINGKSGRCSEDCRYCAQSCHYHTGAGEYPFLPTEEIVAAALANASEGVHRFSIVTAGRRLAGADFESAIKAYRAIKETGTIALCGSHGLLNQKQFVALKEAGVTRYHENLETSRRYFPSICTTHTYDDKIKAIKSAQAAGLSVCSGGIFGMGETWEDRFDMALSLAELGIKSIPLNVLTPIPGTPMETYDVLKEEEILRTIALFRYCNPDAHIRFAAGRGVLSSFGEVAFTSGVSAAITGNMLTTAGGSTIQKDKEMLRALGRTF